MGGWIRKLAIIETYYLSHEASCPGDEDNFVVVKLNNRRIVVGYRHLLENSSQQQQQS